MTFKDQFGLPPKHKNFTTSGHAMFYYTDSFSLEYFEMVACGYMGNTSYLSAVNRFLD